MALKELALFIENNTSWEIGVNFFVGHLPLETPDETPPPERYMIILANVPAALVPDLPDRLDKPIQIWNRARDYFDALEDAMTIFTLWHGTSGWNLPVIESGENYLAMTIDAYGDPAPIENPDQRGFFIFSTNYLCRLEKATCG